MAGNLAESSDFHATLGIFYMPQICGMGPTALLPLRRRAEDFFRPENSDGLAGFEPANLGTKGQHASACMVSLDRTLDRPGSNILIL